MSPIIHTCHQGTYACDYLEGEAVKVRRDYVPPRVEVLQVRVEHGYMGSYVCYIGSSDGPIHDGGHINDIGSPANNGSQIEGMGDGGSIFF